MDYTFVVFMAYCTLVRVLVLVTAPATRRAASE